MELIHNNPFRIAGILSNATERELQKQKTKINAYTKVGKKIKSDVDFHILENIDRTENSVNEAFSNIDQSQDKVSYALFWFLNSSPFDETAIEYLKNGDEEKAIEIWEKVTTEKNVNSQNFSAFNNLGTYKLLSEEKSEIKAGIEAKIKLIESEYFENFVHVVADTTYEVETQKQSELLIHELFMHFKNKYSNSDIFELFSGCDGNAQKYLTKKFTEEPLHKIESQIERCKKKRKENKRNANDFGLLLFKNTKDDLSLLKSILGLSNLSYKTIADQLANELMQCGIDYFNTCQENNSGENYLEAAQELTKIADSIAVGRLTKDRAKDSLSSLEEMKDQEINRALAILKSVKDAYEEVCRQIDKQVYDLQYTRLPGLLGGDDMVIPKHNVSINWSKVKEMKDKALDWNKVVEAVREGINKKDVATIQQCQKSNKVTEYKQLVEFLFEKLGPLQIEQVKHICYWKDVKTAQIKSTAKKMGSKASSAANGGCYIATMAYGDYDHPQVIELRRFRDDFLSKTIIGRRLIKLYYKLSPSWVERLKNIKSINLIIRKGLDKFIEVIKK